jgi:hypothetical protein
MHDKLKEWSEDASDLMQPDSVLFEDFRIPDNPTIGSLYTTQSAPTQSHPELDIKSILKKLASGFLVVVKRQLEHFLPEGRYHNIPEDSPLRTKMKHCQLTNLLGEACFGDLDFSLFKRRNASLHHHSTVNMLKRNRTMSTWFSKKYASEQKELLNRSATLGSELRRKHKSEVAQVESEIKSKLKDMKAKADEKKGKQLQRKESIVSEVRDHGGPCLSSKDVDELIGAVHGSKLKVLKAEISFQKVVLEQKSNFLKVTGNVAALIKNLKDFFRHKANPGMFAYSISTLN